MRMRIQNVFHLNAFCGDKVFDLFAFFVAVATRIKNNPISSIIPQEVGVFLKRIEIKDFEIYHRRTNFGLIIGLAKKENARNFVKFRFVCRPIFQRFGLDKAAFTLKICTDRHERISG